ncbi:MAG: hypothetical protein MSA56_11165 [Clostridium sp.]|jgi:hypothetical protein|nr:hypothetical protein [Clostridium sp.]UVX48926.1 MAG: hypothetical protein [Bacteriophage sp.]
MEFIKLREDRYLIKDSNGLIVSNEEKLKLEKKELIIKDIESNECQGKTTQRIEEIDRELENGNKSKSNTIKKAKSTTK